MGRRAEVDVVPDLSADHDSGCAFGTGPVSGLWDLESSFAAVDNTRPGMFE
jgi:hypothetical protein